MLGLRLGMPRLALKSLEAYDVDSVWRFERSPQECALSVHFCNLAGWAWNVCMRRELPHVRTNAYLDDRLVSADSL